jgi:hypothetical protein
MFIVMPVKNLYDALKKLKRVKLLAEGYEERKLIIIDLESGNVIEEFQSDRYVEGGFDILSTYKMRKIKNLLKTNMDKWISISSSYKGMVYFIDRDNNIIFRR